MSNLGLEMAPSLTLGSVTESEDYLPCCQRGAWFSLSAMPMNSESTSYENGPERSISYISALKKLKLENFLLRKRPVRAVE